MQSLKTGVIFVSQEFQEIRDSKINDKPTDMLVGTPVPGPCPILTGSMDMESQLLNDNVSIVARCPEIPVGGRLTHFLTEWESILSDKWILDQIWERYKLEFIRKPSFRCIKETVIRSCQIILLEKEIENLLSKNAIERVQKKGTMKGFYSTLFLVPTKNGTDKMRPIINLRPLNRYLVKKHFKIDSMKKSHRISRKRRLVDTSRLSRCILSPKNIQAPSQISSIQFQGQDFSVPSSKFRS